MPTKTIECADCGAPMVLRTSSYTYRSGKKRKFYSCSRYPRCRGAHGAHPDGKPMGKPANAATRRARMAAHSAFDALWRAHGIERGIAYRALNIFMGLPGGEAHIGNFDAEQCDAVIGIVKAIKQLEGDMKSKLKFWIERLGETRALTNEERQALASFLMGLHAGITTTAVRSLFNDCKGGQNIPPLLMERPPAPKGSAGTCVIVD